MQAASRPSQETRVGVQLGCSSPGADGGSARAVGSATRPGGGPPPRARGREVGSCRQRCWQSGRGAERLRMGCEPRPQAAEGAGARVEPELRHPGASEHLRAAPRARGGRGSAGAGMGAWSGWGRGRGLRPPRLWATWAETRPCPGAAEPLLAWRRDNG